MAGIVISARGTGDTCWTIGATDDALARPRWNLTTAGAFNINSSSTTSPFTWDGTGTAASNGWWVDGTDAAGATDWIVYPERWVNVTVERFVWADVARLEAETPELRAARLERQRMQRSVAARKHYYEERRQQRAAARAERLLLSHLTPEQLAVYEERKVVPVRTASGRVYEIRHGTHGNVYELEGGEVPPNEGRQAIASYCIGIADRVPTHDHMLAQLMLLQSDEREFLRIANRAPVPHQRRRQVQQLAA